MDLFDGSTIFANKLGRKVGGKHGVSTSEPLIRVVGVIAYDLGLVIECVYTSDESRVISRSPLFSCSSASEDLTIKMSSVYSCANFAYDEMVDEPMDGGEFTVKIKPGAFKNGMNSM